MAQNKEYVDWLRRLMIEAKAIVRHGQGKLEFNVRPSGKSDTNVLITAGKTHRFKIKRIVDD